MAEEKRISAGLSHPQTFLEIKMIVQEKIRIFLSIELLQDVFEAFS